MQNIRAEIRLNRVTSNQRDRYWSLTVRDDKSNSIVLMAELTSEDLSNLLSSSAAFVQADVLTADVYERVGRERQMITVPFRPAFFAGSEDFGTMLAGAAAVEFGASRGHLHKTNQGLYIQLFFYPSEEEDFNGEEIKRSLRDFVEKSLRSYESSAISP